MFLHKKTDKRELNYGNTIADVEEKALSKLFVFWRQTTESDDVDERKLML